MKITVIDEKSPHLERVIELAQANTSTLGFLPRGAFFGHAARKQILVALDESGNFLGYLLYGTNQRETLAYITHLCVEQSQRGKGISKALFNELKKATEYAFRGVRVRCRRDYEVNALWPKLGFYVVGERPGRSKDGTTTLTVWWFDYEHPTLFTFAAEQQTQSQLKVAIDANIFYQLYETPAPANEEAQSLLADWLDVELCLTNEISAEINRRDNKAERELAWARTRQFPILSSPDDDFQRISKNLRNLFPQQMRESDESDLRQISKTIAAGVQFFVTRDGSLLKKAEQVYEKFGMSIIRPSYLITHQDSLIRETEYQPSRLAGSLIKINRVQAEQSAFLENKFRETQKETKVEFRGKLQPYLVDPHTFEVNIIESAEQPLALVVYSRHNQSELEIPILRVVQGSLSSTLARHLVLRTILTSAKEERILTKITDRYLSNNIIDALQENGFALINQVWVKANLPIVETVKTLSAKLISFGKQFPETDHYFQQLVNVLETARTDNNMQALLQVERSLWPAKIRDIDIPTFIVSIQPQWAMDLFDPNIAKQTLFGADPRLMFNVENVYYRSSRPMLDAPARILWYVSQRKGDFQGTMSIRACSYLDEVVVDRPKALFSRFKRLGIYKWKDVYQVAKENINQDIMAFRFSNTELFSNPIHRDQLQKIWIKEKNRNFNILSPLRISNELFLHLYEVGFQTR